MTLQRALILLLLFGLLFVGLSLSVLQFQSALLLHLVSLCGLLGAVLFVAERLHARLEGGERVGLESRWSSLTGESVWQISPATTYLLLLLLLIGLLLAEGAVLAGQLSPAVAPAAREAP